MNALFYLFYHARRLVSGNGDYNLMYIFFLNKGYPNRKLSRTKQRAYAREAQGRLGIRAWIAV
jgi:hypothetical protein